MLLEQGILHGLDLPQLVRQHHQQSSQMLHKAGLIWQTLGESMSRFVLPTIPGSVTVFLMLKKQVNPSLDNAGASFRQHLGLLFVPAVAGIVLFLPELKAYFAAYLLI